MNKPAVCASLPERNFNVPRELRIERCERSDHIAFLHRERHAVAISEARADGGADALAGGDDPGQVQRIGGADGDDPIGRPASPRLAQSLDRVRQGELLARHAGDEPSAPQFSAGFQSPVDPREFAPRGGRRFSRQNPPEHDPVSAKQRSRKRLDVAIASGPRRR